MHARSNAVLLAFARRACLYDRCFRSCSIQPARHAPAAAPPPPRLVLPQSRPLSCRETGACDPCGRCNCQDCCVCVKTCFCPCIVYGDNTAIVENKQDRSVCGMLTCGGALTRSLPCTSTRLLCRRCLRHPPSTPASLAAAPNARFAHVLPPPPVPTPCLQLRRLLLLLLPQPLLPGVLRGQGDAPEDPRYVWSQSGGRMRLRRLLHPLLLRAVQPVPGDAGAQREKKTRGRKAWGWLGGVPAACAGCIEGGGPHITLRGDRPSP